MDFYFDFLSPYGYFASLSVESVAKRHGRTVTWRPMLLGVSVLKVMGLKPLLLTPLKGDYILRDVARTASRLGLSIGRELSSPPVSSLVPARAVHWVAMNHVEHTGPLVHALYAAIWRDGLDLQTPEQLRHLQLPPGLDVDELVLATASKEAAELLRAEVDASLSIGIFGSPTFVVDGEPFWGFDRLDHVDEWLKSLQPATNRSPAL